MNQDEKKYRKYLTDLTTAVKNFTGAFDAQMKLPSTPERGQNLAKLVNQLEMANDQARFFGLGVDWRKKK